MCHFQKLSVVRQCTTSRSWVWSVFHLQKLSVVRQCVTSRNWAWSDNVPLPEAECGQCATFRSWAWSKCHFQKLSVVRQCVTSRNWASSDNVPLPEAECGQCATFRSWAWSKCHFQKLSVARQCVTSRAECGQSMCHFQSWVWSDNVSLASFCINFKAQCNHLITWFTIQNLFTLYKDCLHVLWFSEHTVVVHSVKCVLPAMEQQCAYSEEQVKFWTILLVERNRFRDQRSSY